MLIVEDDAISSALLSAILRDEHCEIDTAVDGEEGFILLKNALYNNAPYSIVYADEGLPRVSGSEMLQRYTLLEKRQNPSKSTVTVSISGKETPSSSDYRFDYYTVKPFRKEEIISIFNTP